MSGEVTKLVENLYYVGIGTFIGTVFIFIFNILSGRILGPVNYGTFTLINSVSMFLYLPMLMGISTAMVKYNAETSDFNVHKKLISTTYMLTLIFSLVCVCIYILLSHQISELLLIPLKQFHYSILFALLFAFYILTTSTIQSLHKMKLFSLLKSIYGIVLLGSFLLLIFFKLTSFESMIFSMGLGYGSIGIIILVIIHKYLHLDIKLKYAKILLKYGTFTLLSGISHIVYINLDKLLINKYMLIEDVGLYNAYYFSSINVITVFSGIFAIVFFPSISKYNDKNGIFKKVNKLIPYLLVLGTPVTFISGFIVLNFYGEMYSFNTSLMVIFSITSVFIVWYSIYGQIYNSAGVKGAKTALIGTAGIAIVNVPLDIFLIPRYGLHGAITATAVAYIMGIYLLYVQRKSKLS